MKKKEIILKSPTMFAMSESENNLLKLTVVSFLEDENNQQSIQRTCDLWASEQLLNCN